MEKEKQETEFLSMLEQNMHSIVKVANVYASTSADREDLVNEIIFELWKSYPRFKGEAKISTWLFRVALNVSLKEKKKKKSEIVLFLEDISITSGRSIFESQDTLDEDINFMYECISRLKPLNKAIILLYLEDKSNEEIAAIIGISRTNVSTRLNRIREELRKYMNH